MADNVTILDANDVEVPVAADDVGGVEYQVVKLDLGAGGASSPVSGSVPCAPAEHSKTMLFARVALSASQTAATVLDPTADKKFVLHKLIVSASGAGAVRFFDNADASGTAIGPVLTLAANGGWTETWDMEAPYRSAAADNILKYTSGAGFAGSVYLEYWEE